LIDVGANRRLKVGEQLVVYRILDKVRHPHTNATTGNPIRMLGEAAVTRVDDKTAMIRVTLTFDEIEIGDRVERFGALPPPVKTDSTPTKAVFKHRSSRSLGTILGSKYDKIAIAEGDFVFIDQGAKHGVQKGDQFLILENERTAHHPDTSVALPVPRQTIGSLTVLEVQDRTSTALVTESVREFEAGTWVQHASQGDVPTG
jgi:Flagellar assembly protein T, C-terminal domain